MIYFITFLEGIITFVSPCMLPMLPIYVSFFAGVEESRTSKTLKNALGFVLGFTLVFIALGAAAGTLGAFLIRWKTAVNIVTGLIVVFFGLSFMGVFCLNFLKGFKIGGKRTLGFFSSTLFGMVFSIGWTPCVGAFLGSALMLASQQGSVAKGILMLLVYSAGLGIPYIASALLIDKLKGAFNVIKRHYNVINTVCGGLLIFVGVLMMTGYLGRLIVFLE